MEFEDLSKTKFDITNKDLDENHTFVSVGISREGRKKTRKTRIEHVPGESSILFPTKDGSLQQRTIRYVPSAGSIFKDEQTDNEQNAKVRSIEMHNDVLTIPGRDRNLLLFLRLAGFNANNDETRIPRTGILYREHRPDEEARKRNEESKVVDLSRAKVHQMTAQEVKAYSLALLDNYSNLKNIESTEIDILRHDLLAKANREPDLFMKGLESTEMKYKFIIMSGITNKILELNENDRTLKYSTGEVLYQAPPGVDVVDNYCALAKETEEYREIVTSIRDRLNLEDTAKKEKKEQEEASSDPTEELVKKAIDKGVIKQKGAWLYYGDHKSNNGKEGLLEVIKSDPELLQGFMEEVG